MKKFFLLTLLSTLTACQPVSITHQGKLRRPIFGFTDGGPRSYECGLTGQLLTGRSSSSNVAAGGCAFCR